MRYLKLQPSPRKRLRVRDLAKQVGISSGALMRLLSELKEYVPSAASYVEIPVVRKIYGALGLDYEESDEVQPQVQVVQPPTAGLSPPRKRPKRNNNPLMPEPERPRDQVDPERRSSRHNRAAEPKTREWHSRSADEEWAANTASDASHAFEFEEWKLRGFTEIERDVWIDAGLRMGQAKLAAELHAAGLTPSELQADLAGWNVLDRLRRGEGATAVARLFRTAQGASEDAG
jgi:hypothetical protein